jgi:hypothetical protein
VRCRRCNHDLSEQGICPVCHWRARGRDLTPQSPIEHSFEVPRDAIPNNSGTGDAAPPEVLAMGMCWLAFYHPWLFVLANRISMWQDPLGWLWMNVWLGQRGWELAWQHRRFTTWDEYLGTMRTWDRWTRRIMKLQL